jgi:Phosphotransferase enzyme family
VRGRGAPPRGAVTLHRDRVEKRGPAEPLACEVEKTAAAGKIGADTGLFRVPRVLDFDPRRGVAVLERLDGLVPLASVLRGTDPAAPLLARVAAALAAVHRDLRLRDAPAVPLPGPWAAPGDECWLHGDFGTRNVMLGPASELVILDWSASPLIGGRANFGTAYFDVATFAGLLFKQAPPWRGRRRPEQRAGEFVGAYLAHAGRRADAAALGRYLAQFHGARAAVWRERLPWWKRQLLQPAQRAFARFAARVEAPSAGGAGRERDPRGMLAP